MINLPKKGDGARIAKLAVFSQAVPMTFFPKICHGADHPSSFGRFACPPLAMGYADSIDWFGTGAVLKERMALPNPCPKDRVPS